jgi:hypothetical protein
LSDEDCPHSKPCQDDHSTKYQHHPPQLAPRTRLTLFAMAGQ